MAKVETMEQEQLIQGAARVPISHLADGEAEAQRPRDLFKVTQQVKGKVSTSVLVF